MLLLPPPHLVHLFSHFVYLPVIHFHSSPHQAYVMVMMGKRTGQGPVSFGAMNECSFIQYLIPILIDWEPSKQSSCFISAPVVLLVAWIKLVDGQFVIVGLHLRSPSAYYHQQQQGNQPFDHPLLLSLFFVPGEERRVFVEKEIIVPT